MKLCIFFMMCCCVFLPMHELKAASCGTNMNDNGDGTITDTSTGLTWKKCLEGQSGIDCATDSPVAKNWSDAVDMGDGGDGTTWRLPNIKELRSIVDESTSNPAINTTCFPNTPSGYVWSSSPYADESDGAKSWLVWFGDGRATGWDRTVSYNVRLVKDTVTP